MGLNGNLMGFQEADGNLMEFDWTVMEKNGIYKWDFVGFREILIKIHGI